MNLQQFDARFEKPLLGIDEVGTGCIAGPVVVAGCILPDDSALLAMLERSGVRDSKKISESGRTRIFQIIKDAGVCWVTVNVHPRQVEKLNTFGAVSTACREIITRFKKERGRLTVLIDGIHRSNLEFRHMAVAGADGKSLSVATASIIAKVCRDREMIELSEAYPGYLWFKNKGYGTAEHLEALNRLGPTDVHRYNTRPVIDALSTHPEAKSCIEPSDLFPLRVEGSEKPGHV